MKGKMATKQKSLLDMFNSKALADAFDQEKRAVDRSERVYLNSEDCLGLGFYRLKSTKLIESQDKKKQVAGGAPARRLIFTLEVIEAPEGSSLRPGQEVCHMPVVNDKPRVFASTFMMLASAFRVPMSAFMGGAKMTEEEEAAYDAKRKAFFGRFETLDHELEHNICVAVFVEANTAESKVKGGDPTTFYNIRAVHAITEDGTKLPYLEGGELATFLK